MSIALTAVFAITCRGSRDRMIFQEPLTLLKPVYTIGRQLTRSAVRLGG